MDKYIDKLTKEDFKTTAPFEYVMNADPFISSIRLEDLVERAKQLKLTKIRERFEIYQETQKKEKQREEVKKMEEHPIYGEYNFGEYIVGDEGVFKKEPYLFNICHNPVIITERIRDKHTKEEYITIEFKHYSGKNKSLTIPRDTIASPFNILHLTNDGLDFSSATAGDLSKFMTEMLKLNNDKINQIQGISKLGWVKNKENDLLFLPYDNQNMRWTGNTDIQSMFDSIEQKGTLEGWIEALLYITDDKRGGMDARTVMAASLASVLSEPLDTLPFYLHLWSDASATGKTLLLFLASSIWGNPEIGQYTQSFQATKVSLEIMASTLNNLPLIMDEAQVAKDYKGDLDFNVYDLALGIGKSRGTKSRGVVKGGTWKNAIITSGESPLVSKTDGAGAFARVIDLNIEKAIVTLQEGLTFIDMVKRHHGQVGKSFIYHLKSLPQDILRKRYNKIVEQLSKAQPNAQQKQLMAIAQIKLADELVSDFFNIRQNELTINYLLRLMLLDSETELGYRVADIVKGYVERYMHDFQDIEHNREQKGIIKGRDVYVLKNIFSNIAKHNSLSEQAALQSLYKNNMIEVEQRGDTKKGYRYDIALRVGNRSLRFIKFNDLLEK